MLPPGSSCSTRDLTAHVMEYQLRQASARCREGVEVRLKTSSIGDWQVECWSDLSPRHALKEAGLR